jgi:hypothetical protein
VALVVLLVALCLLFAFAKFPGSMSRLIYSSG